MPDMLDQPLSNISSSHLAAEAFAALPPIMQARLIQSQRVILIANNPSIDTAILKTLLQPTDMLVLFNDFIHADFFAYHPLAKDLPKLLFFRQIGETRHLISNAEHGIF